MKSLCLLALMLLTACSDPSPKEELQALLSDSRYTREIRKNGYLIKATFLPKRYFELRQMVAKGDSLNKEQINEAVQEAKTYYENGVYFLLSIGYEDNKKDIMNEHIGNFALWSENLQKFYFHLGEYVTLSTAADDDIRLSIYDFQNTFGYTKDRKMLLCFPKEFNEKTLLSSSSEFIKMEVKDWGWGIGKQYAEWDISDLI